MNRKGYIALFLAIFLLLGGCGNGVRGVETASPEVTGSESPQDEQTHEIGDYAYAFAKYRPEDVVMTINDIEITWREYFYRVSSMVRTIEENFGEITAWDEPGEVDPTVTMQEWVEREVYADLKLEAAIRKQAGDMGVKLSETNEKELNDGIEAEFEQIAMNGYDPEVVLESLYLTKETYSRLQSVGYLYNNLFVKMFGVSGANCSDQESESHIEENNLIYSKHILLLTTKKDEETQSDIAMSEEELAEVRALAEDILAQLDAAEDKDAAFNDLMAEYTEDTGYANFKDGYVFGTNSSIVPEYRTTMEELLPGEYSGIVESQFGYHIIMRMEITPETVIEKAADGEVLTVRYEAAMANYDKLVDAWGKEAVVELSDEFKDLTFAAIFEHTH